METWQDIERAMRNGSPVYCGKCQQECEVEERDYSAHRHFGSARAGIDVRLESACCDTVKLLLEVPEQDEEA